MTELAKDLTENTIYLDSDVVFKKFPGGEIHVDGSWTTRLQQTATPSRIFARIKSSDDLMKLVLFKNAYDNATNNKEVELVLPYIPYARQDRIANWGEALSIKAFAEILNNLKFKSVTVWDPHSDVSTALINNVKVIPQWEIFGYSINSNVDLIAPDAGALKKIYKLASIITSRGFQCNIRVGTKHRDTQTGIITGTTLDGEKKYDSCYVVDDICDGGRTFVELGKLLDYEYKTLCVTHGIFSKGLDELLKYYSEIVTTSSWGNIDYGEDVILIM